MKRPTCRRTAGWLGAFLAALVMTGCAGWPAAPPPSAERMMWSTYPLFSRHVLGTCFLIAVRDRTGSYRPVVVTSAHVLEAAGSEPLQIPLRLIGRDGRLAFRLVEVGGPSCRKPFFVSHPAWDVAAFPLPLPSGFGPEEALVFLEERDLEVAGPQVGADVSFLGYPEGMPGTPDLFPVLRGGRVASYDPSMTAARLFLVNGDVFPGDSGGPVFLASASRRLRLEGMVIRRLELSRGEHSPIALAVDAGAIRETVARLRRLPGW